MVSRSNWLTQGGFETFITAWSPSTGTPTLSRSTSEHQYGAASLKVTSTAATDYATLFQFGDPGNQLPGSGGYTLSGWVKGEGAAIGRLLSVLLQDTAGGGTANLNVNLTGAWQQAVVPHPSIHVSNFINVFFYCNGGSVGEAFYVDGVQVETGLTATSYIDTDGHAVTWGDIGQDVHAVPGAGLW
jgi:hypothetical protein